MKLVSPYYFLLFFMLSIAGSAQVGIGTITPDESAILDIASSTQGILTPRMTTGQRLAINTTITSEGLLVFDTDESAFYFYDGMSWVKLNSTHNNDFTGWADYVDGTYTSTNPFIINTTKQTLPNDANTIRDSQKPIDVTEFYDATSTTITGRNGDGINIVIEFKASPNTSASTRVTTSIDIGSPVGEIYTRDFLLSKGANEEHFYLSSFNAYTLDTWEANGGTVKIVATASTDIYDIRYIITRTHKGR